MMQELVVGYELYRLTHDPLTLGLVGLAEAVPYMALVLIGGHWADRYNRRLLMTASLATMVPVSALIWWILAGLTDQVSGWSLAALYGCIALNGLARGIYSPSASATAPLLVPEEQVPNQATWSSIAWQSGAMFGPVAGGFILQHFGISATMLGVMFVFAGCTILSFLIIPIRHVPPKPHQAMGESLREGFLFVWQEKIILYSISLDLFSVLFGGVVAILPVFALDVLHTDANGLGILRMSASVGAVLTSLVLTRYSPLRHPWRNLLWAVVGFGLTTIAFGFSQWFWVSAAMLFLTGAFDAVSVVIRSTILQTVPPLSVQGRVLSINGIFISASNELGAFESGVAARVLGAIPSVLMGGALTLVLVAGVAARTRDLLHVRLGRRLSGHEKESDV